MDSNQGDSNVYPDRPQPIYVTSPPPKRTIIRKILWAFFFVPIALLNLFIILAMMSFMALLLADKEGIYTEEVIRKGPHTAKITVIALHDFLDDEKASAIYKQLKMAGRDENVKGLIIRINSPGGMVSSSDRICNEILKFKTETEKPVVAFMQGLAASGGYYTSVACDEIVAEPTTITGSIGVIFGHFVIRRLLEEKLGIEAVIVKSGEKKDWPSPFNDTTPEQQQYIQDKLIDPAYERFVAIVAGHRDQLDLTDVKRLADGSIYTAEEALELRLIDHIGYLDEAIERAKELADIEEARVVEYKKPFSLPSFLQAGGQSIFKIDRTTLYELTGPQLLYLWTIY